MLFRRSHSQPGGLEGFERHAATEIAIGVVPHLRSTMPNLVVRQALLLEQLQLEWCLLFQLVEEVELVLVALLLAFEGLTQGPM